MLTGKARPLVKKSFLKKEHKKRPRTADQIILSIYRACWDVIHWVLGGSCDRLLETATEAAAEAAAEAAEEKEDMEKEELVMLWKA